MKKLAISNDGPLSNVDLDEIDLISDKQAEESQKNISVVSRNFAENDQVLKITNVQGSYLKYHIIAVHEEKKIKCTICSSLFSSKTYMEKHVKAVHEGQGIQCLSCSSSYSQKSDLKRHIETAHEGKRIQCLS